MIQREDLNRYLDKLLACETYQDYAPNGLQVEGSANISAIATAVTASEESIEKAIMLKCQALIVHHGFFWKGESPVITGMKRNRIAKLLINEVNLLAYHLPLDCHKELGNNARLGQLLGVESIRMHKASNTADLLWSGNIKAQDPKDFMAFLTRIFARTPLYIAGNNQPIQSVAWCTGAAQDFIDLAANLGVDAFISGEVSERTWYQAHELGIQYFSCGHHATERFGIQALGEHLAAKFNLKHVYIDSDNPV